MILKWMLLLIAVGFRGSATAAFAPPLSMLPSDLPRNEQEDHTPFMVNLGLEGAVTQEDWDKATIHDAPPPQVHIYDFMGCSDTVTITGSTMKTFNGREIYAFKGFRFGEAPIGDLRFKKTKPAGAYFLPNLDIEALNMGPKCPQNSMIGAGASGDEDCLFLNVYTPYLPDPINGHEKLPVMVWVHGGAFVSGDTSLYMPTRLLDKDIILVVIQYRLGSLGWFSLDNGDAPGNAGLWDQIEALRWVQDNIAGFGGDPDRVTVAGESAGSASVNYLLLLKNETQGLFQGVIAESGSAIDHWSLDPDPHGSAKAVGLENGCPNVEDPKALYECMKDIPHKNLTRAINRFIGKDHKNGLMGFRGVAPVVNSEDYEGSLVMKHPRKYYEDGDANEVPLYIGANKHEGELVFGIMYFSYLLQDDRLQDPVYKRDHMPEDLMRCFGIEDPSGGVSDALIDAYIGGRDIADFNYSTPGMVDLVGMLFLKAGAWETAKLHANSTNTSTFVYSFDFESDDTLFRIFFGNWREAPFRHDGVCHADEMLYIFNLPAVLDETQIKVKDKMVELWTNFVIYGDPTPDEAEKSWSDLNIPKWLPLKTDDHHYMLIEEECTLQKEYPDRWHITLEEDINNRTTTTTTPEPTTSPNATSPGSTPTTTPSGPSQEDYDFINQQRTAFMACMIVFIITTVALAGVAFYFYRKR